MAAARRDKPRQTAAENSPTNAILKANIRFFLSHPKSKTPAASRLIHKADATKYPISVAFQRFSGARDKIPAPYFAERTRSCAIQLQRQKDKCQ